MGGSVQVIIYMHPAFRSGDWTIARPWCQFTTDAATEQHRLRIVPRTDCHNGLLTTLLQGLPCDSLAA